MDSLSHERRDGCIDQAMTFELRTSFESIRDHHNPEVAAFTGSSVTGMQVTVVDDLQRDGLQLTLERQAQLLDLS
jgi:hypothetical protein